MFKLVDRVLQLRVQHATRADAPATPSADERAALKERIKRLLKEKEAVLVAHYYVDADLQDLAEETGGCVSDSLEMARFGRDHPARTLVVADLSAILGEQLEVAEQKQAEQKQADQAAQPAAPAVTAPMAPLPLLVRVVENKRRNVSAGLGFSTNTGNRVQLNYDDLAIFGLKMKSALTLETKKQTARGDFYFPVTPDGYSDSFGGAYERSGFAVSGPGCA
eukprot:gene21599-24493_t